VVDRPEGPIIDPVNIDEYLTGEWEKKFKHPENSLPHFLGLEIPPQPDNPLPSAEIWKAFLDDPEKMVAHYAEDERVKVPEPVIRLVASAFSGAAGKAEDEEDIARAMTKPYTEEELRRELSRQTKTSGGLTGLNYEIMKMMPGNAFTDMFKIMNRLWRVKHVPKFWTLKGLVGLSKKDEVRSVNDLRPIGLIEVTKKLWTAMVLHRLQYVLKKRLQANHAGDYHCRIAGPFNSGADTEDAKSHAGAMANLPRIRSHDLAYRGRLRSIPDKVNEWYKIGPITEELMRGMFEHVYRARKKPPATKRHIEDHGFPILQESAQRPQKQLPENIADKKRNLTESSEVIKARKAMKLQEKADVRKEKKKPKEQKKEAAENSKKAKTAAKAKERKKRRAKPPTEA
jgi:hypothetical protein